MQRIPLEVGRTYNQLTVLAEVRLNVHPPEKKPRWTWFGVCRCSCGREKEIRSQTIRNGMSKSCGCLNYAVRVRDPKVRTTEYVMRYSQSSAKKRGITFMLTFDDVHAVIYRNCHYCGIAPYRKSLLQISPRVFGDPLVPYNGMDRVDSDRGYTPENIVPCCTECNTAKLDKTHAQFVAYIQRVAQHLNLF